MIGDTARKRNRRSELARRFERETYGSQRKHQLEGHILQPHRAIAFVPGGRPLVLGIDDEQNTSGFGCHTQATFARRQQKLTTESLTLALPMRCDPREQETADIVLRQALGD